MSPTPSKKPRIPKVGFVSLGCPKALVDSERILTHLRSEGYEVSPSYDAADVVVVNTCGFIDSAVDESLDAIGEALVQNGRVIVTGCLGARPERILERHPRVLKVTGPHAYEEVVGAVKNRVGAVIDDERLETEGRAQELRGEDRRDANRAFSH